VPWLGDPATRSGFHSAATLATVSGGALSQIEVLESYTATVPDPFRPASLQRSVRGDISTLFRRHIWSPACGLARTFSELSSPSGLCHGASSPDRRDSPPQTGASAAFTARSRSVTRSSQI
jgi:hypothetical protein